MDEKLKFTVYQKIMLVMAGVCVLCTAGFIFLTYSYIADEIATHYGVDGTADAWGGKSAILFLLGMGAGICLIMTVATFFPSTWSLPVKLTDENRERVLRQSRTFLCLLNLIITMMFSYITLSSAWGLALGSWFLPVTITLIFGSTIVFIIVVNKRVKPKEDWER